MSSSAHHRAENERTSEHLHPSVKKPMKPLWAVPSSTHRRGFTLLELLVVMVIIGMLAAYVGPRYFAQIGRSEQRVARAQIEAFSRALDTLRLDLGRFPRTEEGLAALVKKPSGNPKWNGPYLAKTVPLDPWGQPYRYQSPGPNGTDYLIISLGRDGRPGGEGEDTDITND